MGFHALLAADVRRHPIFHDLGEERGGARPAIAHLRRRPALLDILFLDGAREVGEARDAAAAVHGTAIAVERAYHVDLHRVVVNSQRLAPGDFGRGHEDA